MTHYNYGCQILCGSNEYNTEIIGAYDMSVWAKQMDTLKQVPVSIARVMLKNGKAAIEQANAVAKGKWYQPGSALPGQTSRDNVFWKLDWHGRADGGNLNGVTDLTAIYTSGPDLKKWVNQAFIEANAADAGAAWINQAWTAMWDEIGEELLKLPAKTVETVRQAPGATFEFLTGVPSWVLPVGIVSSVGILGFALYKIVMAAAPAVGTVAAKRYLP